MDPGDGTSPHPRFSQREYKSGNDIRKKQTSQLTTINNERDDNDDKPGRTTFNDVLNRSIRLGRAFPQTYRNLYTASSLQEYLRYQDNSEWESVQSTVIRLFQRKPLAVRQLYSLRENVRELWSTSRVGPLLFDFYLKQALSLGMTEIRDRLTYLTDTDLIQSIEESWTHFYSELLPTLQAIFFPFKPKHIPLRHAILICFRDGVLLKINLKEALQMQNDSPPPDGIRHMLLILQSIHDTYPPNENYLTLERLVAMVVSPYMGYRGIYEGEPEPVLRSKEPDINRWNNKRCRPPTTLRTSTLNPNRAMDTLEEMFYNAYSKDSGEE